MCLTPPLLEPSADESSWLGIIKDSRYGYLLAQMEASRMGLRTGSTYLSLFEARLNRCAAGPPNSASCMSGRNGSF